jgi:peptide/nickel transport system ATP-binding protein
MIEGENHNSVLVRVRDLTVHFPAKKKSLFGARSMVHAVDGVSFDIRKGTSFGLVGESGSGKTTTALAMIRLIPVTSGMMELDGVDVTRLEGEDLRRLRRRIQIIFQDPYSSLNPRMRAGDIVREPMDLMNVGDPAQRREKVGELFRNVGLRPEQRVLFPHQFSGGQRQRIGVARALASQPDLIVCDEPVSALDVAIQAQILNLLRTLQKDFNLTYFFISHDLGVIQYMCDEIAVMYLGQIVEQADRVSLFKQALHPYTQALFSAVPSADPEVNKTRRRLKVHGDPPSPVDPRPGCRFAPRCFLAKDLCRTENPVRREVTPGHFVSCHLLSRGMADGRTEEVSEIG